MFIWSAGLISLTQTACNPPLLSKCGSSSKETTLFTFVPGFNVSLFLVRASVPVNLEGISVNLAVCPCTETSPGCSNVTD